MQEIDYSNIQKNDVVLDEEWEPPQHRYFGKKLPNGKTEKEPVYIHSSFPAMMYAKVNGNITAKVVNTPAEKAALGDDWKDTPEKLGLITAPSFEQATQPEKSRKAA